jgi:hypothetical protein
MTLGAVGKSIGRRLLLQTAGVTAIGLSVAGRAAAAAAKIGQRDAKYRDHPNGQQRCAICLNFEPPKSCKLVAGPIVPAGWCQFFAARENAH